jgi:hypothetical protein
MDRTFAYSCLLTKVNKILINNRSVLLLRTEAPAFRDGIFESKIIWESYYICRETKNNRPEISW